MLYDRMVESVSFPSKTRKICSGNSNPVARFFGRKNHHVRVGLTMYLNDVAGETILSGSDKVTC